MRTNIVLNDSLIDEGLRLTRCQSKRELVELALRELVQRRKVKPLTELAGKIGIHAEYDHKSAREVRPAARVHDRAD